MTDEKISRRELIAGAAITAGTAFLPQLPASAPQQGADPSAVPGGGSTPVGARSPFEAPARTPVGVVTGVTYSPLHQLTGTITPNDLLFERHHSGIPAIDPTTYKLLVHGLVDRAMVFTLAELKRLPSVSRIHFLECSGNGRAAYTEPKAEMTAQIVDGMVSNGEWTGVPLSVILREAGVQPSAKWLLAEGGDSNKLSRSIPMEKAMDDAMVVYAFNGEPLRPGNGYPVRMFLPGFEGNTCVKWLRRIKLIDQPNMSKDETSRYTDPLPSGKARQFSFIMDVKSVITSPSYPARIERGWREISGLAWSGRGKIRKVEVSTDGGRTWAAAELTQPVLSKAHTRFRYMWDWNGRDAMLMSRASDETGATQPTLAEYERVRGKGTSYHYNYVRSWRVGPDGQVTFGGAA